MTDKPMYLHKNPHGTYYYRRPVPLADQSFWRGPTGKVKREWSCSLRTKERRLALVRMLEAGGLYESERQAQLQQHLERGAATPAGAPQDGAERPEDHREFAASNTADYEWASQQDWEAEHDPLWPVKRRYAEAARRHEELAEDAALLREVKQAEKAAQAVSFMDLYEDWAARHGKPDTQAAYRSYAENFQTFVGKADANDITADDLKNWRASLQTGGGQSGKPVSNNTINGAYMAAVKSVFQCAFNETNRIATNPGAGITALRVDRKPQLREKSIRDDEALLLLADALKPGGDRLSGQRAAAKRWCPWIMAYTGARVNEVAQLRKQDVGVLDGIAYVEITPEAGKVKTETVRKVPLHPHLIQQGFLEYVNSQPDGPLFYDPDLGKGGRLASQTKKVGQYLCKQVRALGVTVAQPNHGWRHRMETMNNRYDLRDRAVRMIVGHASKDSHERYGDHELPAMLREIEKIPAYQGRGIPSFRAGDDIGNK